MKKTETEYYVLRYKNGNLVDGIVSIDTKEQAIEIKNRLYDKDQLVVCRVKKITYLLDNEKFYKEELITKSDY